MMDAPIYETFEQRRLHPSLRWHCEPAVWCIDPSKRCLRVEPSPGTDFWQRTHYGFEADNGHFLYLLATGDFVLTTQVTSRPAHQYDQAGLMVRISPSCWLKTSVEYEPDGADRLGAVVTNSQFSDWSTQYLSRDVDTIWFRVRAEAEDCIIDASRDGRNWEQIRMAHLSERASAQTVACGLYACSPRGAGYQAEFRFLRFEPGRLP